MLVLLLLLPTPELGDAVTVEPDDDDEVNTGAPPGTLLPLDIPLMMIPGGLKRQLYNQRSGYHHLPRHNGQNDRGTKEVTAADNINDSLRCAVTVML